MNGNRSAFYGNLEMISENRSWFLALGITLIALGILAIALPLVATFAVELLIGWVLIFGGGVLTIHAFRARRWGGFLLELLIGLLNVGVGFFLLMYPLHGVVTLTLLLAIFFTIEGVFKIIQSLAMRRASNWVWMMVSGVVSLVLGMIIWANLPFTAAWALGVIVGVDLLFWGWSMVMIALTARKIARPGAVRCVGDECFSQ